MGKDLQIQVCCEKNFIPTASNSLKGGITQGASVSHFRPYSIMQKHTIGKLSVRAFI